MNTISDRDQIALNIMYAMIAKYGLENDDLSNIDACFDDSRKAADKLVPMLKKGI